jgi:GGDEF domain-containing protein
MNQLALVEGFAHRDIVTGLPNRAAFVLLLRLRAGELLTNVQRAAGRIIAKLPEPATLAGQVIKIGCSVGGAIWTSGEFAEVLAQADGALYQAKRAGKSQAQFTTSRLAQRL